MRVLLIKTSSMGDVIHTLPALTDAGLALPGIQFDWVVEEAYAEIPAWHPLVAQVIPVQLRRWRKNLLAKQTRLEWQQFRAQLGAYDIILDAQALVKSAFLTWFARGKRVGLNRRSAREALAALAYQQTYDVNFYQHAIVRMRSLFSQALGYALPTTEPEFAINPSTFRTERDAEKYIVFLHGTTWESKQYPESYWISLANLAAQSGYRIKISGGNDEEVARAERIAAGSHVVDVLPRLRISQMAALLANAHAAIAVDTGFGHLAAAFNLPTVSIYGSTNPQYTGALGHASLHLTTTFPCSPCYARHCTYRDASAVTPACYATLAPIQVWMALKGLLGVD